MLTEIRKDFYRNIFWHVNLLFHFFRIESYPYRAVILNPFHMIPPLVLQSYRFLLLR